MTKHLAEIAKECNENVLNLVAIAKELGISSYNLNESQEKNLISKISGYDELTNSDIREIDYFLRAEDAINMLNETAGILDFAGSEGDEEELKRYLANDLYELMISGGDYGEEFGEKITPEIIYETIANLGVMEIYRSSRIPRNDKKFLPSCLMKLDENLGERILINYFVDLLEGCKNDKEVSKELNGAYKELKKTLEENYGKMKNGKE
jgi:hypothetical protein